jgi:hypothetical protein
MTDESFRKAALALPGAVESAHMDHPDFRVQGKVFASLGYPAPGSGMVKLTPEQQETFVGKSPEAFAPCRGAWGRAGATEVQLQFVTAGVLQSALEAAFRNITTPVKEKSRKLAPPSRRGRRA